jgi:TRAP-type mannitol/chloroaromatic compound transport system substrate-binding protein
MKKFIRRDFLKAASVAAVGAGAFSLAGCETKTDSSPISQDKKTYEWKMVTTWPPHFPILGEYADEFAKWINEMSEGRLKIQVYGGGELVPALEVFDAVSQGVAEMGHGAAYYWAGKLPSAQFFGCVPFGMNAQQVNAWLYFDGGLELWRELYSNHNLMPFPCGNTGGQMGGWFNKEINSLKDFVGLKMRIPGLGGKVITKTGATSILAPGGELYTDLDRGVIDALEWVGPYHDSLMGFDKIAKYYYYPGWQEPGSVLELIVNKNAYDQLPADLKNIIEVAAAKVNVLMLSAFEVKNTEYYLKMKKEGKVQFRQFSDDILEALRKYTKEVIDEITSSNAMAKKVYDSYSNFKKNIYEWDSIAERNYKV